MFGFVFGTFLILFGLPQAIWPYKIARFGEQVDAIGSKRSWSEVEPAGWKVILTKLIGFGLIIFGGILILMDLF